MLSFRFKKLDDEMHFWAGMLISFFVFMIANFWFTQWQSGVIGLLISFIGGVGKEIYDLKIKKTKFDWRDIKWTTIGGSILSILFIIFDIIYYYSKP